MIAHLDLDAFYAAVELHRRPDLRGRPLVVGGDPAGRGVVATASYEARRFGIRSAMSSAEALRRCPHAVFVRPDHRLYREWSRRVWDLVAEAAPVVEQTGIDEGYLVLPGGDAAAAAAAIQRTVREQVRLSCSLGVASCKVVAKIASDMRKPGGLTVVPAGGEAAFLAPLPLARLPGAGPRTCERLARAGIGTIGDLAALDEPGLAALLPGRVGELLHRRANGIDGRPVVAEPAAAVSISSEETFPRDIADRAELHRQVQALAHDVAGSLAGRGVVARTVFTKLRYPDFTIATRSHTMRVGTDSEGEIARLAARLLDRALNDRPPPLRLLGVGASGLDGHRQLTLLEDAEGWGGGGSPWPGSR